MAQRAQQHVRLSPRFNHQPPFDTCMKSPEHDQSHTSPETRWPKTGCGECSKRGLDCVSDINNPRCRNCTDQQRRCSYEARTRDGDEHQTGVTNTKRSDSLGAAMCCQCNSTFTTDSDRASQGSQLYKTAAQVFALELVLDIGEACLKGGLPFPLRQARLRLATPNAGSDDVDGHVVAEGEPMVSSFGAVESLLNVLKAVPEVLCCVMDAEALMGMFTLRWNSPQVQGKFLQTCSACYQFKDRS